MVKILCISSYIIKSFLIYDLATCTRSHLNILIYEENLVIFFIILLLTAVVMTPRSVNSAESLFDYTVGVSHSRFRIRI
jgi:hypothetical protein